MRGRRTVYRLALCVGLGALGPLGTIAIGGAVGASTVAAVVVGIVLAACLWIVSGDAPDDGP